MNAHVKLSREETVAMARAIFVGASPQEVSVEHGVSVPTVMSAVEKVRRQIAQKTSAIPSVPANRNIIQMEPKTETKPTVRPLQSAIGRELGILAVSVKHAPSMPYVRFLHGERA
jgi:hypothetical protein